MHFPTWIDLKGQDSVPETVHHVVSRSSTLCSPCLAIAFRESTWNFQAPGICNGRIDRVSCQIVTKYAPSAPKYTHIHTHVRTHTHAHARTHTHTHTHAHAHTSFRSMTATLYIAR